MKYISKQKNQLLDSLENQVQFADLVSVIIGNKGIGKTFILNELNNRLNGSVYLSEIIATATITPRQLQQSIILQLGLTWNDKEQDLLRNIELNLNQRVLITIDDAHLLSLECLNFLLKLIENKQHDKLNSIYIVLAGEVQLASKLNTTEILIKNPNVCVVFEIEPIEMNETKYFIAEYQQIEINKVNIIYDDQKLSYFWQLSKGNPKELLNQLKRWLDNKETIVNKAANKSKRISKHYFIVSFYSLIAVLLILILIYQDQINNIISPEITNKTEVTDNSKASIESEINTAIPEDKSSEIREGSDNISSEKSDIANPTFQLKPNKNIEELQGKDEIITEFQENLSDEIKTEETSNNLSEDNISNKLEIKLETKIADEDLVEPKLETAMQSNLSDEERLLELDDNTFTLQLMAVSNLDSANKFKSNHPLSDKIYIYLRKTSNTNLYVIIYGSFATKQQANMANAEYAAKKYPGAPWIKGLKAVKKEINDTKNYL